MLIDWTTWRRWRLQLGETFWFVPGLMVIAALLAALGLIFLDSTLRDVFRTLPWIYDPGPTEARSMLSTIASSVITVAATTFSITIAAVSLASQQYGPRRLRSFMADRGTQIVLGTFCAAFAFCLVVLRSIHGPGEHTFVPHVAATAGLAFALASVGVLIYFVHHVATTLQVEHLIDDDTRQLDGVIARLFVAGPRPPEPVELPGGADAVRWTLRADRNGYVQFVDIEGLVAVAAERDWTIDVVSRPGTFVGREAPLLHVRGVAEVSASTRRRIAFAMRVSERRTADQDPVFAVQQVVEIAVRALSPAINAPYTAVTCVDRIGASLSVLTEAHMPAAHCDGAGVPRVHMPPVDFDDMLAAAFDDVRSYAAGAAFVRAAMVAALDRIAARATTGAQRAALWAQLEAVRTD